MRAWLRLRYDGQESIVRLDRVVAVREGDIGLLQVHLAGGAILYDESRTLDEFVGLIDYAFRQEDGA